LPDRPLTCRTFATVDRVKVVVPGGRFGCPGCRDTANLPGCDDVFWTADKAALYATRHSIATNV